MHEFSGNEEQTREHVMAYRKYMYEQLQNNIDVAISYFKNSLDEPEIFNILRDEALEIKEMLRAKEIYGLK